jgi:Cof subfamily protein (haloacid dehalogenase superfamily)
MSKNKTLYISDLDGTLLNNNAELSDYTKRSLNYMIANGCSFSVATARTLATSEKILADVNLNVPIILLNGVKIYDVGHKQYIKVERLNPEAVTSVIQVIKSFDITGFMYELKDNELMTYHESLERKPLRDFVEERVSRYNKTFYHTDSFSGVSPEHVIYLTLLDTYERLVPVRDSLASLSGINMTFYKDNYSPDLWYLEMFSDKASKENAVKYLRDECRYEHIIGFGDNLNDLPMFAACDVRVAVENAKDEVKVAADYICGSNDNDGVVKWIEAFV